VFAGTFAHDCWHCAAALTRARDCKNPQALVAIAITNINVTRPLTFGAFTTRHDGEPMLPGAQRNATAERPASAKVNDQRKASEPEGRVATNQIRTTGRA
jgi:hypothetical protein